MKSSSKMRLALVLATCFVTIGCGSKEPSDESVRANFQRQRREFEELRLLFERDAKRLGLKRIDSTDPQRTSCQNGGEDQPCQLPGDQWQQYSGRLKQVGVLLVEREEAPARVYFVTYYEAFLMDARLRGTVFSPVAAPDATTLHPNQKWKSLQEGWHSFLMVDT